MRRREAPQLLALALKMDQWVKDLRKLPVMVDRRGLEDAPVGFISELHAERQKIDRQIRALKKALRKLSAENEDLRDAVFVLNRMKDRPMTLIPLDEMLKKYGLEDD